MKLCPLLILTWSLMACSAGQQFSESTSEKTTAKESGSEVSVNNTEDEQDLDEDTLTKRPHEEGEGLPGFLVNPQMVTAQVQDSSVLFKGEPGSVKRRDGTKGAVAMSIFVYSNASTSSTSQGGESHIKIHSEGTPFLSADDGSFEIQVTVQSEEKVLISTTQGDSNFKVQSSTEPEVAVWQGDSLQPLDQQTMDQAITDLASDFEKFKNTNECIQCNLVGIDYQQQRAERKNFEGSNFSNAILSLSNFSESKFANAKFNNATVIGVSFASADLRNADFTGADTTGCNFDGADLTGVIGLSLTK